MIIQRTINTKLEKIKTKLVRKKRIFLQPHNKKDLPLFASVAYNKEKTGRRFFLDVVTPALKKLDEPIIIRL